MAIRDLPGQPVIGFFSFTPYASPKRTTPAPEPEQPSRVDEVIAVELPRPRRRRRS
jgi:hypothetical protein